MAKARIWMAVPLTGLLMVAALPLAAAGQQPPLPVPPPQAAAPARRPFQAPSDGKLTEKQIKMYIDVRRLAATLAKPDPTVTDPLAQIQRLVGSLNSETTAASQLGADIEEFRWVSLQISASGARPASDTLPLGDELTKALLAASGKAREAMGLPATDAAAADATAAAAAYNRELLNKFKPELDALAPR